MTQWNRSRKRIRLVNGGTREVWADEARREPEGLTVELGENRRIFYPWHMVLDITTEPVEHAHCQHCAHEYRPNRWHDDKECPYRECSYRTESVA